MSRPSLRQLLHFPLPGVATLLLAGGLAAAQTVTRPVGDFDFYVLALSWSPSFCEGPGRNDRSGQCAPDRELGFVVHGLWPQYEEGWPQFCNSKEPEWLEENILRSMLDIMPSRDLVIHQWKKHGRCSGLSQRAYFDFLRAAAERIELPEAFEAGADRRRIGPEDVKEEFMIVNSGLDHDEMAVTCDRRTLREVRICLTRDLEPRSCPEVDARSCTRREVIVP